ncbi:uncharacterized protein L203_105643 [Cryptococcus depauperatus CBS 7841]|uniref:Uncharacterized protein n=1 Tax=Cryptococcus depauperatus CBS 7841 TaxID=1295531 RepID=A0AAJ8M456_9TREE
MQQSAVAAVVIIGLAMRTPAVWVPMATPTFYTIQHPPLTNHTESSFKPPTLPNITTSPPQHHAADPSSLWPPDKITLVIVLLALNLIKGCLPESLKTMWRELWFEVWQKWNSPPGRTSQEASVDSSRDRGPTDAAGKSRDLSTQTTSESQNARKMKDSVNESLNARRAKDRLSSDKSVESPRESTSTKDKDNNPDESTRGNRREIANNPLEESKAQVSNLRTTAEKQSTEPEKGKLSESEKAQTVRSKEALPELQDPSTGKGKKRMDDERPGETQAVRNATSVLQKEGQETGEKTSPSTEQSSSALDMEDALMSGDYRPLKSAIKKPRNKPKQSKNIHHNLFMTMRGWRPALIPFPHGFHPKPHHPRNSLWWDNIPRDASHLMAPPAVAKAPRDKEDETEDKKEKPRQSSGKEQESKPKDISETKEKAKKKQEAEPQSSSSSSAAAPKLSPSVNEPQSITISLNPEIEKTTCAIQALLCVLLYFVDTRLGLVLIAFLVWQQINKQYDVVPLSDASGVPSSTEQAVRESKKKDQPSSSKDRTDIESTKDTDQLTHSRDTTAEIKDLMEKLKSIDAYIKKYSTIKNPSEEQAQKLTKAESQQQAFKTQLAKLQQKQADVENTTQPDGTTRNSSARPESDGPAKQFNATEKPADESVNGQANANRPEGELAKIKFKLKELEGYLSRYRKLESLTEEQEKKMQSAKKQWRAMRQRLSQMEKANEEVGLDAEEPSSG